MESILTDVNGQFEFEEIAGLTAWRKTSVFEYS